MRALYVYPHPDDESFGPAHAMANQRRGGHEVFLLTLTRGGATRQRHRYGYSVEEMGAVRYREMQDVARVLDLTGMTVLDFPDGGLKEVDPRELEAAIADEVRRVRPHLLVGYPVHGISGFHDHLVGHAVVKRVFVDLRDDLEELQRLAFHTITEEEASAVTRFRLTGSRPEEIDAILAVDSADIEAAQAALDCYVTFQETIQESGIRKMIRPEVRFEIFGERHAPPLSDLFANLRATGGG